MPTAEVSAEERVVERLRRDFPLYAERCLTIVPKVGPREPFVLNAAQRALDAKLEAQRLAGHPQRAVVLKARQVGISTYAQGKLIQRTTLNPNHSAMVVAHDLETGAKMFSMAKGMYSHLPDEERAGTPALKPKVANFRRARHIHFGDPKTDAWMHDGEMGLSSEYLVSTAGESESGRGGTYKSIHGSELAFWPNIDDKATAIVSAVNEDADTLVLWESTANGHNGFKDIWDLAVAGGSEFIPFFWPWWKHEEYVKAMNDAELQEFRIGDTDQSPYAEGEGLLVDPGPFDFDSGEHIPLTVPQLAWRRWAIANKCGGRLDKFNQEFPTQPEDAFLTTGNRVFESLFVRPIIEAAKQITPDQQGVLEPTKREMRGGRFGPVEVPLEPQIKSAEHLMPGVSADWKFWGLEQDEETKLWRPPVDGHYCIGVDVSGGVTESEEGDPAYHAIEVIDHQTGAQVCEYVSRCDPDLLGEHVYLAAQFFNNAWTAIEVTGGWGLPPARTIWLDWRYPFLYFRQTHERSMDHQQDRLGWNTDRATKPILLAGGQEIIRSENHGIRSPELGREMLTYVRADKTGKTAPERGKFSDRLMAWLIAQQVKQEKPLRLKKPKQKKSASRPHQARNPVTGY